jgi:hypothetical protein
MKRLEDLAYAFFGNNLVIGAHIRRQLAFLKEIVPAEMLYREMDDLGCGDGKVTVLLKEVFQPAVLRGFDIHPGLVRRAEKRGIIAEVADLDKRVPTGELAVVWGVLHHLKDFKSCLRRLKENYPLIFIREPVKTGFFNGLELGHPLRLKELTGLLGRCLTGCKMHYCNNSVLVFYACSDYLKCEEGLSMPVVREALVRISPR